MKRLHKTIWTLTSLVILVSCNGTSNISSQSISSSEDNSSEQSEYDAELKIFFDVSKSKKEEISPYIYGTFIEHIDRCIYNGIWGEIINDRKFVAPIGEDVSQWKKDKNSTILSDSEHVYSNGYSAHLIENSSFYQRGLQLDENCGYDGYLYGLGQGKIRIDFSLATGESISNEITIDSKEFKKYSYHFTAPSKNKYTMKVEWISGDVYLDSLSLMKDDNINGMRKDTLEKLKELNAPFYRWPGGNFVSGYDFEDGIGQRDKRPCKRNLEYAGLLEDFVDDNDRLASDLTGIGSSGFYSIYEPNDFGIDEFIYFCNYLNAEPNIVLNAGLGSVQEAIDEVEYIKGTNSEYALRRPQKEPYDVTYFSIGNEMNGSWQLGHMSIDQYVIKHNQIAEGIKKVDPNIKIIGVGDNWSSWSQRMIDSCKNNLDYLSEHFYADRKEESVADHINSLKYQAETRINKHRSLSNRGQIKMAIDEYMYDKAVTQSRLKDGLGVASCLNVFMKNSDVVDIACYSSTINAVQGQIYTDAYKAYMEGGGYVLSLYRNQMQKHYLEVNCNLREFQDYIEVSSTISEDKKTMSISVINTSDLRLKISNSFIAEYISKSYVYSDSFEGKNNDELEELNCVYDTNEQADIVLPRSLTIIKVHLK